VILTVHPVVRVGVRRVGKDGGALDWGHAAALVFVGVRSNSLKVQLCRPPFTFVAPLVLHLV